MEIEDFLSDLSKQITEQRESVIQQLECLDQQKTELQENLSSQIEELSKFTNQTLEIPTFEEIVKESVANTVAKYNEKQAKSISTMNASLAKILSQIQKTKEIKEEIEQKLEKIKEFHSENNDQVNQSQAKEDQQKKHSYVIKFKKLLQKFDQKASDDLDERNRKMDEKLHKTLIEYNKCKQKRIETENRIKDITKMCQNLSEKINKSYEIRARLDGRSNIHNFTICKYPEEDVTLLPAKRKSTVELGSLIVLAPIKSLSRRQRFAD